MGQRKMYIALNPRDTMDCMRGVASLPVGDEPTEEVYLVPDTGKPGAKYYNVRLIPIL